jgi:hypothetical protein
MNKVKNILVELGDIVTVGIAATMISSFLKEEVTLLSIGLGLVGYLMLLPAQEHYVEAFKQIFKRKVNKNLEN